MSLLEDYILDLSKKVEELRVNYLQNKSNVVQQNSTNQVTGSAQRIPISGDEYFIDFDGSANLKTLSLTTEGEIFRVDDEGIFIDPDIVSDVGSGEVLCITANGDIIRKPYNGGGGDITLLNTHWRTKEYINTNNNNRPELWLEYSATPEVEESWIWTNKFYPKVF